ncbi:hypothetical protein T12_7196 [Trichinella patagoniensis]|uniref:Uncharacterized protein n=1 Tax=Trichinella patagoniensis TaxID=990121 RepID=A0A0V0ZDB3_9BILA|nr:hypothetical protein T12_7196 [Trichinella patagoniensis]
MLRRFGVCCACLKIIQVHHQLLGRIYCKLETTITRSWKDYGIRSLVAMEVRLLLVPDIYGGGLVANVTGKARTTETWQHGRQQPDGKYDCADDPDDRKRLLSASDDRDSRPVGATNELILENLESYHMELTGRIFENFDVKKANHLCLAEIRRNMVITYGMRCEEFWPVLKVWSISARQPCYYVITMQSEAIQ